MKIGVSSYSFSRYIEHAGADYLKICDIAKDMGFEGIEFIDLDLKIQPAPSPEALAQTIRSHCDEIGLPIAAYTVHADFIDNPDEAVRLRQQVDIAAILGAKVMRHDVSWRRDVPWREMVERTAPRIRELTEYAQTKGVRTCTENHGYVMQDAHRVETLIRTVDHPNFGWLVDMGNFLCADEPPMHALPIAAPYAFHAHAKDFLWKAEKPNEAWFPTRNGNYLRGTIVGEGVVPLRECIAELKKAGYDGWLSLEFEGIEENLNALKYGLAYLKAAVE